MVLIQTLFSDVEETVVGEIFGADIQHFGKLCRRISRENKMNHCFFIGLDEGTKNILRCSFVHPNTEQLPCFARSQAMMSLEGEKNI